MADPISIATGVIGILSSGIRTVDGLYKFYKVSEGRDTHLTRTANQLKSLLTTLKSLEDALQKRSFQVREQSHRDQIETSIRDCEELIEELNARYKRLAQPTATKDTVKQRPAFPFRNNTLEKITMDLGEIQANISTAVNVLQLQDNQMMHSQLSEMQLILDGLKSMKLSESLMRWLDAPDASVEYNAACAKRSEGTGEWLSQSDIFTNWLAQGSSFLWLHGFAGCGKTVLSSTCMQYCLQKKRSHTNFAIAYFSFTFTDKSKQDNDALLRALVSQLAGQIAGGDNMLQRLYDEYQPTRPAAQILLDHLRDLIRRSASTYIVLDALDESPRGRTREKVLETVNTMRDWALTEMHLLVTARDEIDVRMYLAPKTNQALLLRRKEIDHDIIRYVSDRLTKDPSLRKWCNYRERIMQVLADRAQGVFRWVDCQLESLKRCVCSSYHLEKRLQSLPRSLDETYERMLCGIHEDVADEARRMLMLLCLSVRPLTVVELIEAIAVDTTEDAGFDPDRRMQGPDDLREICPGLIEIFTKLGEDPRVRIAHFSVQEYLESPRIKVQRASRYAVSFSSAHAEITSVCCLYLLHPGLPVYSSWLQSRLQSRVQYPFAFYASENWAHHLQLSSSNDPRNQKLIRELFLETTPEALYWPCKYLHGHVNPQTTPVYLASCYGIEWILSELLQRADFRGKTSSGTPFVHEEYSYALKAACIRGHEGVAQQFLDAGVAVNSPLDGGTSTLLIAAAKAGRQAVMQMLVDAGAVVDAQVTGHDSTALIIASSLGQEMTVCKLIELGADVNLHATRTSGPYTYPLQAACLEGHEKVIRVLLDAGATVNTRAGSETSGSELAVASSCGHEFIVNMLLDAGADINAKAAVLSGNATTALMAAAENGRDRVVQTLLEKGADPDLKRFSEYGCTALEVASFRGHEGTLQKLLDAGANPNIQTLNGTSLIVACSKGHPAIVERLLESGADVNAHTSTGSHGTALIAAAAHGYGAIAQRLLDAGAQVNTESSVGSYGTALIAASYNCDGAVVQKMINAGAQVNARPLSGRYGTALIAACATGSINKFQMLLRAGAKIDLQALHGTYGTALIAISLIGGWDIFYSVLDAGPAMDTQAVCGDYGTALIAASFTKHERWYQRLVQDGAAVNAQAECGKYGTALIAACCNWDSHLVKYFLEAGADANAPALCGEHGTALIAASHANCGEIVKLLLDASAEVNAEAPRGDFGTALIAASALGHKAIVHILLEAGAQVTQQVWTGKFRTALEAASTRGRKPILRILLVAAVAQAQGQNEA